MAEERDLTEQSVRLAVRGEDGKRLDVFIAARCPDISRSQARRLIDEGLAAVNGRPVRASYALRPNDFVDVRVPAPEPGAPQPEGISLRIIYEDSDIVVIDKPAGMAVHPGPGRAHHTLVNALLARYPDLVGTGEALRPGIVHRLDKDTSGILLVARNERAHADLSRQLKERLVEKRYLALVTGRLEPGEGVTEGDIGRDPRNRKRMAIVEGGRPARTAYRVVERLDGFTLVEVAPSTGRTHQIRVHLAGVGHPVVGDALYGRRSTLVGRQFLHARRIAFSHPADGRPVEFESPLPADLAGALRVLGAKTAS
ncbi:MAG: RluA family pseudouridine synthase [Dehalococcoidia bacterium]|jgi:23S rRNA pseudouridine1911/1915/1917 synthase